MFSYDKKIRIIIIEDEEFDVKRIRNTLSPLGNSCEISAIFSSGKKAVKYIEDYAYENDVVIMDYQISGSLYGEELIESIKSKDPFIQVIVITKKTIDHSDIYFADKLLKNGACWYGTKYPADIGEYIYQPTDFVLAVLNAYERKRLECEKHKTKKKKKKNIDSILSENEIIGVSDEIKRVKDLILKYAISDANILITGKSGVGKELVAKNIHYRSKRRYENFVAVNCAAIPNDLIESELFGYTKGSFTGAKESKPGLFEQANGGTIFLDEVGEMSHEAQAKLLRIIETGELEKIGREKSYKVNVRIISATNSDIKSLLKEKKLRVDLFYRLNVLNINVKPLMERKEDIPVLLKYFIDKFSDEYNTIKPEIPDDVLTSLINYEWPGNVRQLKNFIQRILLNGFEKITQKVLNEYLHIEDIPICEVGEMDLHVIK